jgi:transposase
MFFPEARIRVFLYGQPADMRKSYDGLYALARSHFDADPLAGHLFVFANRRATQIKVLYFDRSGWCLWGKRLEAGRFVRNWGDTRSGEIDCTRLKLMLEGIEEGRQFKRYRLHRPGIEA